MFRQDMIVGVSGQLLADGDLEPKECVVKIASLLRYIFILYKPSS